MKKKPSPLVRCSWPSNPLSIRYHDEEWGKPQHDDRVLFEFLLLEGAQAGLSWDTILQKRENYRAAFDGFDPERIAGYDRRKMQSLLAQSRHCAQPAESCFLGKERESFLEGAEGVRLVRPLHLAVRGRKAEGE